MRRNLNKTRAFCKRFSVASSIAQTWAAIAVRNRCPAVAAGCTAASPSARQADPRVAPLMARSGTTRRERLETTGLQGPYTNHQRLRRSGPAAQSQPLASISFTAARFLAPICSAETPSALNGPNRLRIALSPVPRSGYSLLASA